VLIGFDQSLGYGEGDGRLPDPARSGDGEQTPLAQQLRKFVDNIGASSQSQVLRNRDRRNKSVAPSGTNWPGRSTKAMRKGATAEPNGLVRV
jgi:hypothetical protein